MTNKVLGERLAKAIENNDVGTVKSLLTQPEEIDFTCEHFIKDPRYPTTKATGTIMLLACAYGNAEIVQELIKAHAPLELQGCYTESTPLHEAATFGHLHIIDILIDAGAKLEILNSHNNTPLANIFLSYCGQTSIVEVMDKLLARGANINPTNGKTPLINLVTYTNHKPKKELLENLIERGADINMVSDNTTPLLASIIYDQKQETILSLLKHGADYRKKGIDGITNNRNALELVEYKINQASLPNEKKYYNQLLQEMQKVIAEIQSMERAILELYRGQRQPQSILSHLPKYVVRIISKYAEYNGSVTSNFIDRIKYPKSYVERVLTSEKQQTNEITV
jgi:ankyrin repeat protein